MKIFSFSRGGLERRDDRAPSGLRSRIAYLPAIAVLPLLQHEGVAAKAVVSEGDSIRECMVLGRSDSRNASVIHASIPGTVVRTVSWRMPDGRESETLIVKLEGSFDKLGKRRELFSWNGLAPGDLQRTIAEKGVVEMDGPGRSVSELLSQFRGADGKTLLAVNAVFDDPWLAAESAVLSERAEAVAEGLQIAMKVAGVASALIAVDKRNTSLAFPLSDYLSSRGIEAQVAILGSRYPQRNFREFDAALKSYHRSQGSGYDRLIPLGPSTLAAIYDAVRLNLPLVERYVAVGGDAVKSPDVLRVRIGTRIGDAIAECGGFVDEPARVVVGSPLTGYAVSDLDSPITKTTGAVVAVGKRRLGGTAVRACIGCGNCRAVCPVGLDPERLHKLIMLGRCGEAVLEGAGACHGCACCATVCPSRLPLRASILYGAERGGPR